MLQITCFKNNVFYSLYLIFRVTLTSFRKQKSLIVLSGKLCRISLFRSDFSVFCLPINKYEIKSNEVTSTFLVLSVNSVLKFPETIFNKQLYLFQDKQSLLSVIVIKASSSHYLCDTFLFKSKFNKFKRSLYIDLAQSV